jgi:hypothetical protein
MVELLWMSDQLVAETSTWQHTTLTTDKHPCPPVGFEPTISTGEQPQTYASYRAVTGDRRYKTYPSKIVNSPVTFTYSMQHNRFWETNRFSASQNIPRILWNLKVHYRIHKFPPPFPTWASSVQSIPPHPTSWRSILILSSHLRLNSSVKSFLSKKSKKKIL